MIVSSYKLHSLFLKQNHGNLNKGFRLLLWDDALVAPADRLKIGKCNLRLSSDVTSKEATLQVVYDVLKLTPFYKAFQVTADAPEIYMQEFWASAYVHNRSVRFKMNTKSTFSVLINSETFFKFALKSVNWHYARDDPMFTTINVISRNEDTQLYRAILCNNRDLSRKKSGKGKLKTTELETISEADLTEAEQLKIITKRSRQETHSSHASGSGADEGTGVTPGVPDAPDYDSEDDISWKSSDDDQVDEQAQDDEDADKNDVNETTQDDEDDDDHDDDEKVQDDDDHDDDEKVQDDDEHDVDETVQEDDDEEQTETESDDDGDDFVHPKLTTHDDDIIHEEDTDEDDSRISSSDDEDSDNEVEGANVEGAKTDEEATYEEDQGNEAVDDTNTDLDRRDDVMTDVILPQVQATQEIEDTHVTYSVNLMVNN
ncbi:hypothetical protein Tco_0067477 [Tanacetum coccineum]